MCVDDSDAGADVRDTWRFVGEALVQEKGCIVREYALTIYVNDREMATVVCTPTHLEELVVGFLASEGVIRTREQLQDVFVSRRLGAAYARVVGEVNFNQEFYNKRYLSSCCGKGRQSFYFANDAQTARPSDDASTVTPAQTLAIMQELEDASALFRKTGGVHTALLRDGGGRVTVRSDIGRHNALDKLYGHRLLAGDDPRGSVIAFSGRLSSEVLLKVAKLGAGVIVAKSAPTTLAIELAEELRITAIGFARAGSFVVYAHPWRVVLD
jgi:FdhD protein